MSNTVFFRVVNPITIGAMIWVLLLASPDVWDIPVISPTALILLFLLMLYWPALLLWRLSTSMAKTVLRPAAIGIAAFMPGAAASLLDLDYGPGFITPFLCVSIICMAIVHWRFSKALLWAEMYGKAGWGMRLITFFMLLNIAICFPWIQKSWNRLRKRTASADYA